MAAADITCARCERPVKDGLTLCVSCGNDLCSALLAVPELLLEIAITRAGLGRTTSERTIGRPAEPPLPVQSVAQLRKEGEPEHEVGAELLGDRALAALGHAVITWARAVAEDLGVSPHVNGAWLVHITEQHRGSPPRDGATLPLVRLGAVEQAAVWLAQHREILRAHEAGLDMLYDITEALDRLRAAIDRRPEKRYLGPCPNCRTELRAEPGESWVRCRACREQYEIARIEADARAVAEDRLYTLAELVPVLDALGAPVPKRTLYWWASERKIEPRGWMNRDGRITDHRRNDADKAVYRTRDALRLAGKQTERGGSAA
ncbi:hypothetical protein Ntsu_04390 [Nocardia sp. IFM 10818]